MPADGEDTKRFQPEPGNDGTAEQPKRKCEQGVPPLRAASGAKVNADVRNENDYPE